MKRAMYVILGLVLILGAVSGIYWINSTDRPGGNRAEMEQDDRLKSESSGMGARDSAVPAGHDASLYFENILSGGVPKDGIPPIDSPKYIGVDEANLWLGADDPVFVLEGTENIYVYPQRVLVWHEIVNESIDGKAVSITYCPLTGSCIGYYGPEGTSFGTSGRLLNSNLVMYDRETEAYWPQIMGQAVHANGVSDGLDIVPVHWTTWKRVLDAYGDEPDRVWILSDDTGFFRDYERDPYGSYEDADSYYYNNRVMFPTMGDDDRLPAKKVVVAVKGPDGVLAIDPNLVKNAGPVYTEAGGQPVVAFFDAQLNVVRVFKRERGESPRSPVGLEPADHFDVMWFAWIAFYPDTDLLE